MAKEVNVSLTNIRTTGSNVSVPQRAVDITVVWKNDAGQAQSDTRTLLFPNILTAPQLPPGWLQDKLIQLCYEAVRVIVGIDQP